MFNLLEQGSASRFSPPPLPSFIIYTWNLCWLLASSKLHSSNVQCIGDWFTGFIKAAFLKCSMYWRLVHWLHQSCIPQMFNVLETGSLASSKLHSSNVQCIGDWFTGFIKTAFLKCSMYWRLVHWLHQSCIPQMFNVLETGSLASSKLHSSNVQCIGDWFTGFIKAAFLKCSMYWRLVHWLHQSCIPQMFNLSDEYSY